MNELSGLFVHNRCYFWDSRNHAFASGRQQLGLDVWAVVCADVGFVDRCGSTGRSMCLGSSNVSSGAVMKYPLLNFRS